MGDRTSITVVCHKDDRQFVKDYLKHQGFFYSDERVVDGPIGGTAFLFTETYEDRFVDAIHSLVLSRMCVAWIDQTPTTLGALVVAGSGKFEGAVLVAECKEHGFIMVVDFDATPPYFADQEDTNSLIRSFRDAKNKIENRSGENDTGDLGTAQTSD